MRVGESVGLDVGAAVGDVGPLVGLPLGESVGAPVGKVVAAVGDVVGLMERLFVGLAVGNETVSVEFEGIDGECPVGDAVGADTLLVSEPSAGIVGEPESIEGNAAGAVGPNVLPFTGDTEGTLVCSIFREADGEKEAGDVHKRVGSTPGVALGVTVLGADDGLKALEVLESFAEGGPAEDFELVVGVSVAVVDGYQEDAALVAPDLLVGFAKVTIVGLVDRSDGALVRSVSTEVQPVVEAAIGEVGTLEKELIGAGVIDGEKGYAVGG